MFAVDPFVDMGIEPAAIMNFNTAADTELFDWEGFVGMDSTAGLGSSGSSVPIKSSNGANFVTPRSHRFPNNVFETQGSLISLLPEMSRTPSSGVR